MARLLSNIRYWIIFSLVVFMTGCTSIETRWENAKCRNSLEGYEYYLERYPKGKYSEEARERLANLKMQVQEIESAAKKVLPSDSWVYVSTDTWCRTNQLSFDIKIMPSDVRDASDGSPFVLPKSKGVYRTKDELRSIVEDGCAKILRSIHSNTKLSGGHDVNLATWHKAIAGEYDRNVYLLCLYRIKMSAYALNNINSMSNEDIKKSWSVTVDNFHKIKMVLQ